MARSRVLAGTALFAAMTLVLNESIKIPAPYASFLTYEVWEIPIVVALLIFGAGASVGVALVNFVALQLIYPGQLAMGPLYNLSAILLMLFGIWVASGITEGRRIRTTVATATGIGVLSRVVGMTLLSDVLMPLPPPVGFAISPSLLLGFLVLIAVFNASVALYTIPFAFWLARAARQRSGKSPALH